LRALHAKVLIAASVRAPRTKAEPKALLFCAGVFAYELAPRAFDPQLNTETVLNNAELQASGLVTHPGLRRPVHYEHISDRLAA
jgi:hypothetical protein